MDSAAADESPPSPRLLGLMLGYGFASGLPLPLCVYTLHQWFATAGISLHAIGLLAFVGLPYTLKFLWSPVFDRPPPAVVAGFGRRRGWLLVVQPALALGCVGLALTDPARNAFATALAALLLAFLSASQDVIIDAWRIGVFPPAQQGNALAAYIWGYQVAMIVANSGVIWIAAQLGWHLPLFLMAVLMLCGTILTLVAPEPTALPARAIVRGVLARFEAAIWHPLRDFLMRPGATAVLAFVILFHLGKVFADGTAAPFYHHLGFALKAIADANFLPSLLGTFGGAACGGLLVARIGIPRAVLLTGTAQAASLGMYLALLAHPTTTMLFAKVGLEFFAWGAADAAFLAYVSSLCSRSYSATQYALLSSLAALVFHTLGGLCGYTAEALGWPLFFAATIAASLPALLIMLHLQRIAPINQPVTATQPV
jgi:PAT family beta-lactamase induction signal transducer AmpG